MKKLPSLKQLKKTTWESFSKQIRKANASHEGYVSCVSCGKTEHWRDTDCGHYHRNSERNALLGGNELWYDKRNFAPQCKYCNRMTGEQAGKAWGAKMGETLHWELYRLKQTPKKWTREELLAIKDVDN